MYRRLLKAGAIAALAAITLSGCSLLEGGAKPSPSESADPRAVSSKVTLNDQGFVTPGSGVTVGTTVPTFFLDSSGKWSIDLTIDKIVEGKVEDMSVIQGSSTDLTGLVPYYTTITAKVTKSEGDVTNKSLGTLFGYVTKSGAKAPRLVSINGVFPACTGSDAFPAPAAGSTEPTSITFCQVSLGTPGDPVDQVNWHPDDTPYNSDDGKPVFFRPATP